MLHNKGFNCLYAYVTVLGYARKDLYSTCYMHYCAHRLLGHQDTRVHILVRRRLVSRHCTSELVRERRTAYNAISTGEGGSAHVESGPALGKDQPGRIPEQLVLVKPGQTGRVFGRVARFGTPCEDPPGPGVLVEHKFRHSETGTPWRAVILGILFPWNLNI